MTIEDKTCGKLGVKIWYSGKDFSIYYFDAANPTVLDVIDTLDSKDQRKTRAFLSKLADNKKVLSLPKKSKKISQNLFRLKTTDQLRFMYFCDDSALIITH